MAILAILIWDCIWGQRSWLQMTIIAVSAPKCLMPSVVVVVSTPFCLECYLILNVFIQAYTVREGCYSSGTCSATVTNSAASGAVPCKSYSATNTNSATQNVVQCSFYACSGTLLYTTVALTSHHSQTKSFRHCNTRHLFLIFWWYIFAAVLERRPVNEQWWLL